MKQRYSVIVSEVFCSLFLFFTPFLLSAQITIQFPIENMVFQRGLDNQASVLIQGTTTVDADSIFAEFSPRKPSAGFSHTPQKLRFFKYDNKITFSDFATVKAGWYELKISIYTNRGQTVTQSQVAAVGVGEVFLVAGQSNAQGQPFGQLSAKDERVVCSPYSWFNSKTPTFKFNQMSNYYYIYPTGEGAWCWSELGDMLVQRLNVPVLFFNAALGGSSSADWANSISNQASRPGNYRPDEPFVFLRTALETYVNMTGFRAVLWHQGEADTGIPGYSSGTGRDTYFKNISLVINESRKLAKGNLGWVISRASYIQGNVSSEVVAAQNNLINAFPNAFAGPNTDVFTEKYRSDNIHFSNEGNRGGITALAGAWNQALNDDFFKQCIPKSNASFSATFDRCTQLTNYDRLAYSPADFSANGLSFFHENGNAALTLPKITAQENQQIMTEIAADNSVVCKQKSVRLYVKNNHGFTVRWSNDAIGDTLTVNQPGTFSASFFSNNPYCLNFERSAPITIFSDSLRVSGNRPIITTETDYFTCPDHSVTLKVADLPDYETVWQDYSVKNQFITNTKGAYRAFYRDTKNCRYTDWSEIVYVKDATELSFTPINYDKKAACEGETIRLSTASPYNVRWSNNLTQPQISVKESGNYTYQIETANGCVFPAKESVRLEFKANPPGVQKIERRDFDRLLAIANSTEPLNYAWQLDNQLLPETSNEISIKLPGIYSATTYFSYSDALKCYAVDSPQTFIVTSEWLKSPVNVYPNPVSRQAALNLQAFEKGAKFTYRVYKLDGSLVQENVWNTEQNQKIKFPASGMYLLELNSAAIYKVFKVLVTE